MTKSRGGGVFEDLGRYSFQVMTPACTLEMKPNLIYAGILLFTSSYTGMCHNASRLSWFYLCLQLIHENAQELWVKTSPAQHKAFFEKSTSSTQFFP